MSIWNDKSILLRNFTLFFIVVTHNSAVNFKLTHFLLWMKGSHEKSQFWNFQVLWWKFAKFLMSFSKPQSVFCQILHHSEVSWKITPLYFFRSNIIYFGEKELIKGQIFETIKCLGQTSSNFLCQFWNDIRNLMMFDPSILFTLHKRNQSKCKFWRLSSSAQVKIHQILVIFETTDQFFFKFRINLQGNET